ncbi:MAG: histidine--tRNA ligase [Candidatus Iainarchaeum sp.]|jgi:histidyl-tRNA synthetase|nr:MAG: Histidine--tRNA ligase [archaeon ADurb.Bin336]
MNLQPVRGMRDLVGQDALIQEFIEGNFRRIFASFGYAPLYTPAVENFDLFKIKGSVGEAIKEEIYYFKDKGERELALRFEFTASLARVAATTQLKMPFKRYQIGEVYRYDRPQAKRYRAFTQADIDILGVGGLEAEIEIMQVIKSCFESLKLKPKVIFNSRKLLQEVLGKFALGKEIEAMRILDKMDKVEKKEVKLMLEEKGIDSRVIELIEKNSFEEIQKFLDKETQGTKEIKDFINLLKENELDFVEFDARLARGFEYYTGIVFEIKLDNGPSVGGGGRFDKLISTYGGQETPAVGVGLGVSRIFDYLKENGFMVGNQGLYLFGMNVNSTKLFKIANILRKENIFVEIDLNKKNLSKNIEFAQKKGYKFVGIIGENELKANTITIKNIENGEQENISLKEIEKIKSRVNW